MKKPSTPAEKIADVFARVKRVRRCLLWTGAVYRKSNNTKWRYPRIMWNNKPRRGNRLVWELIYGPITNNQHVLHHCDESLCLNYQHMYLGSPRDNGRDCSSRNRTYNGNKTHCPRGHAYKDNNVVIRKNGGRVCRACVLFLQRERRLKERHQ